MSEEMEHNQAPLQYENPERTRLIAAADDLLNSCKVSLLYLEYKASSLQEPGRCLLETIYALQGAIAKAEGIEP